ncbi:MAG: hypothetical protein K2Q22_06190, partial [Cytophagales bacterium]|nr:hypothetical protein [Cytophagales bacterium]
MKNRIFSKLNLILLILAVPVTLAIFILTFNIHSGIRTSNELKRETALISSQNVLDKIDRNFYERFGDVQAFAYNRLAVDAAQSGQSNDQLQHFINTMTSYYVLYDLMMLCDKNGNVIALNTKEKTGKPINTAFIKGKNFAQEPWFQKCMHPNEIPDGAWYSDYMINMDVAKINNDNDVGWGMAFAAPVKNDSGLTVGVWYNFANWNEVTMKIREMAELELSSKNPGSHVILTNQEGTIIDAFDPYLVLNQSTLNPDNLGDTEVIQLKDSSLLISTYEMSSAVSQGAYTYKGNRWKAVVLIPRETFQWSTIFKGDLLILLISILLFMGLALYLGLNFSNKVTHTLTELKNIILNISQGELTISNIQSDDEIGQMSDAINQLSVSLKDKVRFSNEIGLGNLTSEFQPSSPKDVLGFSLLEMRKNLMEVKEEDRKRQWITEGLATFGNLLRSSNDHELYDRLLSQLVHYIGANQGAIFLLNPENSVLKMVSCYAYQRKKYLDKEIQLGEGLAGQSVLEKEYIYLTEIPANYIAITSGLGEALPRAILVMPLMT